ncbi:MAG: peptidoglycan DD-metalloendopeptidase family protein [Gemmatimonadota bacterium]|nr:peptidoglycan DD-metalloendopeptidase family protein [Gemmatimonadota bacterium]
MTRLLAGAALAVGIALAAPASAQDLEEDLESQRSRLERLQEELKEKRAEAARLGQQETSVLRDLRRVEQELEVTQRLIGTLERQIEERSQEIRRVTVALAEAQDELAVKRQILARRLRSIYKLGKYGDFEVLLKAASFPEVLSRYKYLRLIASQDRRLVERIARLEARIRHDRASLESARETLAEAREERIVQRETLSESERDRERMLERVKSRRSEQIEAARRLEEETEKIRSVLATLERRRAEREELARRAAEEEGRAPPTPGESTLTGEFGALDWPVDGKIVERFGRSRHPVYNTEVVNNGIDIAAPAGTPVRAVEAGKVVYADWNGGYGQMVILDHDGGYYSLYAHLARMDVAIGESVAAGDRVGSVGETGSLTGAKLHFEIRKGGRAVDPIGWLKGR